MEWNSAIEDFLASEIGSGRGSGETPRLVQVNPASTETTLVRENLRLSDYIDLLRKEIVVETRHFFNSVSHFSNESSILKNKSKTGSWVWRTLRKQKT